MNNRFEKGFNITNHQTLMRDVISAHRVKMAGMRFQESEKFLGFNSYMEQRKLVLSFGRQMGHSTFIAQNANLHDFVVVCNENIKNEWKKHHYFSVITIDQIRRGEYKGLGHLCDILWFDGSRVYEKLETNEYNWLCSYLQPMQVVVLGE